MICVDTPVIESLESRCFFSVSAPSVSPLGNSRGGLVAALAQTIVKVRGTLSGRMVNPSGGSLELVITILTHTHTGKLTGTVSIRGAGLTSELNASFTGKVRADRHVSLVMSHPDYAIRFTGHASKTGGRLSGSFLTSELLDLRGTWYAQRA